MARIIDVGMPVARDAAIGRPDSADGRIEQADTGPASEDQT
jgi:hypothetical protein